MNDTPVPRRRARLAAAGACAVAAFALAGCHAKATVAIQVHRDGSGTVTMAVALDRDARRALAGAALKPSTAASRDAMPDVPLTDLRARGWKISPWQATANGGASITLARGFAGPDGLEAVFIELDGIDRTLRDARVMRTRSLLHDRDSVSLLADLTQLKSGVRDDHALTTRLRAAGVDVAAIDKGLQSRIGSAFDLTIRVELPDGSSTVAHLRPGDRQRVAIASRTTHSGREAALVGAALAVLLALVLLSFAAVNARRTRRA